MCERHCVAHAHCNCCWTHGIWNESNGLTRQSVTLRVYDPDWGRRRDEPEERSEERSEEVEAKIKEEAMQVEEESVPVKDGLMDVDEASQALLISTAHAQ